MKRNKTKKNMKNIAHAILLNLLGEVTVFMPQKSEEVSVFTPHPESIKHLLDVCSDCDEVLPETQQHTQESVVQVGACEQH